MKANNLFGDDSPTPNTPIITEISLKDLCSQIDFDALKSQAIDELEIPEEAEEENSNEDDDMASVDENHSCTLYLSRPPLSKRSSCTSSYSKRPSVASSAKRNSIASSIRSKRTNSICQDIPEVQVDSDNLKNENSEMFPKHRKDPVVPNGNLHFSNSYTITECRPIYDDTNEEEVSLLRHNLNKSPSMPSKTRYKYNGSKHRKSWQESSVDDVDITELQYDDITKDDLLLMWKASEMELNAKLQKALREKSRLQRLLVDLDTSQEPTPV